MSMTKREAKAHKITWNNAIREGRAVRLLDGVQTFATVEEANAFVAKLTDGGYPCNIVDPSLAQS